MHLELVFRKGLRDAIVQEIERRGLDTGALAEVLGMLPSGAHALLERDNWNLQTSMRVAHALNIRVEPVAQPA